MDNALTDLSRPALATAVRANLQAFFRYLGRAPNVDFHAEDGLVRWCAPLAAPWLRGVLVSRPPAEAEHARLAAAIAYFREREVPRFTWWLAPGVPAEAWHRVLRANGFGFDSSLPGMAVVLDALQPDPRQPAGGPAPAVRVVADLAGLRLWTRVFLQAYELPANWERELFTLLAGLGLDWPMRHYLAYLGGEPAATSSLFLGAGVAGLQFVATLPAVRGRGLGGVVSLAALHDARAQGYHAAVGQSSQMGFRTYQRLGIDKVCDVDHYYWPERQRGGAFTGR